MGSTSVVGRHLSTLGACVSVLAKYGYENSSRPRRALFDFSCLRLGVQDLRTLKKTRSQFSTSGINVEVRGLVVSVYTITKGDAFVIFGDKTQNQTVQKSLYRGSPRNQLLSAGC
jgi:hypothetical protein